MNNYSKVNYFSTSIVCNDKVLSNWNINIINNYEMINYSKVNYFSTSIVCNDKDNSKTNNDKQPTSTIWNIIKMSILIIVGSYIFICLLLASIISIYVDDLNKW